MANMNTIKEIIESGFCIGCGACVARGDGLEMQTDAFGWYRASSKDRDANEAHLCPFSDVAPDEATLSAARFKAHSSCHPTLGFYTQTYAGYVMEDQFRERGASGGFGTWILHELLRRGVVDHVIHVKQASDASRLFEYGVSSTLAEVIKGSKSRYYPVEMSGVLKTVLKNPGRYVIVGLP